MLLFLGMVCIQLYIYICPRLSTIPRLLQTRTCTRPWKTFWLTSAKATGGVLTAMLMALRTHWRLLPCSTPSSTGRSWRHSSTYFFRDIQVRSQCLHRILTGMWGQWLEKLLRFLALACWFGRCSYLKDFLSRWLQRRFCSTEADQGHYSTATGPASQLSWEDIFTGPSTSIILIRHRVIEI